MSEKNQRTTINRVKTGAFERRFSMAKMGLVAGSRLAAQSAGNMFTYITGVDLSKMAKSKC